MHYIKAKYFRGKNIAKTYKPKKALNLIFTAQNIK